MTTDLNLNLNLNDVHSRLNATRVAQIERPASLAELQAAVRHAAAQGLHISVAGGRHAMGGQQFAEGSLHIDTRALNAVLGGDAERGLLHIQAGADWPRIIEASHALARDESGAPLWAIRQKQTGVDEVTLGGSIAANAHGRGLLMQPLADDVEALCLVDASGDVLTCSRERNAELFALVLGGYGMFGIVASATLRLTRRQKLMRLVDVLDLPDALAAVQRRAMQGALYGDFQFVIDARDAGFLQRGVFACYVPAAADAPAPDDSADLQPQAWLQLLKLAHDDKARAFALYAQHYLGTHGRVYWADTMQLSTYIPSYADYLERERSPDALGRTAPAAPESLVIGEHYVPQDQLLAFMVQAREVLLAHGTEVIYGTIRAISQDTTSYLPWARGDFACVIFNLRTPHTPAGQERTAQAFRGLTDASVGLGGSFFLTYHRHASAAQVLAAYPRFREWLACKRQHDPQERFTSNWYRHYRDAFAALALGSAA